MMKNRILSALWVCALIVVAVSLISIAESAECVPVVPCITCAVGLLYLMAFHIANCW